MASSTPPSSLPHHTFEFLRVEGAKHFRNEQFDFSPSLNCPIGGRGAGKSTLLLFLRFAIGAPLSKKDEAQVCTNLGAGRVVVGVRTQHGVSYTASRRVGEPPRVTGADGQVAEVSLDGPLFKADFYAQTVIETIADDIPAQLAIIDKFTHADGQRIAEQIALVERRLLQKGDEIARLDDEIAEDEGRALELPSIEATLAGLAPAGGADAEAAKSAQHAKVTRGRERAAVTGLAKELVQVGTLLDAFARDAKRRLAGVVDATLDRGENGAVMARVGGHAHAVAGEVETAAGALRAAIVRAEAALEAEGRALATLHAAQDDAYQAFAARTDVDRERTAEREKLQARFVELSAAAKRVGERTHERDAKAREHRSLLDELLRLRAERYELRRGTTVQISARLDGVKVSIAQGKDTTAYAKLATELLKGASSRPADLARPIAQQIPPHVLAADARANDPTRLIEIDRAKTGREERALRILATLRATGRLAELEIADLGDEPLIELMIGGEPRPISKVSVGERCTAILPILLLQSASPLVIDQPEDHLDNAFIYAVFVPSILKVKLGRQLIFATHNPNLPVLGDAERVLVLKTNADGGYLSNAGDVDQARDDIETILEGGREAFLKRSERYGHGRGADAGGRAKSP